MILSKRRFYLKNHDSIHYKIQQLQPIKHFSVDEPHILSSLTHRQIHSALLEFAGGSKCHFRGSLTFQEMYLTVLQLPVLQWLWHKTSTQGREPNKVTLEENIRCGSLLKAVKQKQQNVNYSWMHQLQYASHVFDIQTHNPLHNIWARGSKFQTQYCGKSICPNGFHTACNDPTQSN